MKRIIVVFLPGLVLSYPLEILAQTTPDKKADSEMIEVINQWGKLWNENDSSASLAMYHPDAKITYGRGNQKGTASRK